LCYRVDATFQAGSRSARDLEGRRPTVRGADDSRILRAKQEYARPIAVMRLVGERTSRPADAWRSPRPCSTLAGAELAPVSRNVGFGRGGFAHRPGRQGAVYVSGMLVAVFGDSHAHAEPLAAVIGASDACGVEELWSRGDMVGGGPHPERVVRRTRESCTVALVGNHDYGATGSIDPLRLGEPGSRGLRSLELARERLSGTDLGWLQSRKPAARRDGVQCRHGGPRHAVWEYVGSSNAGACLAPQRAGLGLVGHTDVPAAWQQTPRGARPVKIRSGVPLDIATGKWLLNPGAVGRP
jgi:hypothetical protein